MTTAAGRCPKQGVNQICAPPAGRLGTGYWKEKSIVDNVRGLGRAIFAAVLLVVGGVPNFIYGIAAISNCLASGSHFKENYGAGAIVCPDVCAGRGCERRQDVHIRPGFGVRSAGVELPCAADECRAKQVGAGELG
jgi:hypothetical protein